MSENLPLDGSNSVAADLVHCGGGKVQAAIAVVRSAVIDADGDRLSVACIRDLDATVERQRFVCCGHCVAVEPFAVGGLPAVEAVTLAVGRSWARTGLARCLCVLRLAAVAGSGT